MNERVLTSALPSPKPPLAVSFVHPLRVLLALMSIVGLLSWSYNVLFVVAYYGKGVFASPAAALFFVPYAYLLTSLYFCVRKPSIKTLSIMGLVLNAPLVAIFIYWLSHIEDYLPLNALVPVAYILVWFFLWLAYWFVDHEISARTQAVTIAIVSGGLLLGAALVWPLMIDHESQARNFLQAAVNGSPGEARTNFAESLQHTTRIRRFFNRSQMLQQIAIAQAQRKLYDDSSTTLKSYLENGFEERDKEQLLTSIVMAQLKNKDYEIALATARTLNSYMTLQIQYFGLEAVSKAQEGKDDEARQILNVATTLANEQKVASLQKIAFMHIAEAQAKIGWHDGALDSARRAGPENSFALLGSIGVNEAEAGHKESARQTMRVIDEMLGSAVDKCLNYGTETESDRCLLKLVNELGDDRFFHLARSAASKISSISERDLASRRISNFGAKYLNSDLEDLMLK
jgi:hypothetical protein